LLEFIKKVDKLPTQDDSRVPFRISQVLKWLHPMPKEGKKLKERKLNYGFDIAQLLVIHKKSNFIEGFIEWIENMIAASYSKELIGPRYFTLFQKMLRNLKEWAVIERGLMVILMLLSKCIKNKQHFFQNSRLVSDLVDSIKKCRSVEFQVLIVEMLFRVTPTSKPDKQRFLKYSGLDEAFLLISASNFQRESRIWLHSLSPKSWYLRVLVIESIVAHRNTLPKVHLEKYLVDLNQYSISIPRLDKTLISDSFFDSEFLFKNMSTWKAIQLPKFDMWQVTIQFGPNYTVTALDFELSDENWSKNLLFRSSPKWIGP
jgi:hypothetical protein